MNWPLFGSTFAVTFLAELPDKTAFASILMATRRRPSAVFCGAAAAFLVQTVVAVTCGRLLNLLPGRWVHAGAGILFLILAVSMWRRRDEDDDAANEGKAAAGFWQDAVAAFVVIFAAEWGDLTQFSTAALVAKFGAPGTIFCSAVLALWAATGLAVILGAKMKDWLKPAALKKAAAICFALVGLVLLSREF